MKKALVLSLLAAAMSACSWQEKQVMGFTPRDPHREIWLDDRIDPDTVDDRRALAALERRIDRGELPEIKFALDSDVVPYEYYPALDAVADWMLRHPDRKLRLTARACSLGTPEYNLQLSRRRARSLKAYLVSRGVPPPSIRFLGLGEEQPLASNASEETRRRNRSVQLRFVLRDWDSVY